VHTRLADRRHELAGAGGRAVARAREVHDFRVASDEAREVSRAAAACSRDRIGDAPTSSHTSSGVCMPFTGREPSARVSTGSCISGIASTGSMPVARAADAQVAALRVLTQRRGKITVISSLAARVGCEGRAAHSSSKGGVELPCADRVLTDVEKKARDAGEKSAPVKVRIQPHRPGMPLEIADLNLFLTSPASDVIRGHGFFIDGGYGAV